MVKCLLKPTMAVKGACALFFLLAFHFSVQAQILAWDFNTNTGSEATVNAGTNNTNLNTSVISRGAGITGTALSNAYSSTGFTASGTLADAKTNNKYLQFNVNSKSGYKVSLSTLDFNFRRSSTGPNAFQWQYSLDGFTTAGVDLGAVISYTTSLTGGDAQPQISLSGITSLQNLPSTTTVTFRLFAYGATAITGTFALGRPTIPLNDLAVGGTVAVSGGVDTTAPTVSTYSPLNSSANSNLSLTPYLSFSENVQKGTGNITISNLTDATSQIIDVANAGVTINSNVLNIGGATFINGKSYAIQIAVGAIKDLATAPNDFAGISNNTTWAFSFNANPTATNDAFTVYKNEVFNGNVATNDSDPNSSTLTYSKLTDPVLGSLTFNTNGTFNYTPQTGYTGIQTFTYRVTNSSNYSSDATVTLNINERTNVIISQYYEGTGVNKWIELTNTGTSAVNTASPQLQLALYNVTGDTGNITYTNATTPTQKMNLNIMIPAKGAVIIGNPGNGIEISYVSVASANQNDANVINFNGNDGIALLDANNQIIDAFGQGINAKDVSYERNQNVTTTSDTFVPTDWTQLTLLQVQEADDTNNPIRLGVHIPVVYTACAAPLAPATQLVFSNVNFTSIDLSFTASNATNEYLIIRSTQATLGANPVNGTTYNVGDALGNGSVTGRINSTSFSNTGLSYGTTYYYFIYSLNNVTCTGGPIYQSISLNGSQSTNTPPVCAAPTNQPSNFTIGLYNYNFIQGSYTTATTDEYLVVMSTSSTLTATPVNGTVYSVNQPFGGGIIVKRGTGDTFTKTGLTASTPYYFTIYALNSSCTGGPVYQTVNPLLGNQTTMAQNSGALNYYYGNLHAHSSSSDGNKEDLTKGPVDDFAFAKTALHMDFLGISEHNHTGAGMALSKWQPGLNAAQSSTSSTFTAMYGMEWGTISGGGHVVVYGIDSLIGWEPSQYQIYVAKGVYQGANGLFNIINRHGLNAIAYLAHPNSADYNSLVGTYDAASDQALIGSAVESGPAFSTNTSGTEPATSMSYLSYFNNMLAKGYHIAPTIDHDNHYLTFGKTAKSRLVILAPSNTQNDLLNGMKAMHFYATEDYAAQVGFNINTQPMGSILTARNAPVLTVNVANATSSVNSIKLIYGTPGSGVLPVQIASSISSNSLNYTDNSLANLATGYYYADITETDGTRTITAPIWYTRDDAASLPVILSAFDVKASGSTVNINWTSSSEINNDYYTVERSDDGKNFAKLTQVKGAGTSQQIHQYQFIDDVPFTGVNYYRIRQTDFDGKSTTSEVKAVKMISGAAKSFNIYPNPAQQQVTLALNSNANDLNMRVVGVDGRLFYELKGNISILNAGLNQKMGSMKSGLYLISIANKNEAYSAKLIKQ